MIAHLTVLLLATLAASANPGANKPWHWDNRNIVVDAIRSRGLEANRPTRVVQDVVVSDCGEAPLAPPVKGVIVGGTEASPHSFPWQVALHIDFLFLCGGSIISDEWVMTAAHCLEGADFVEIVAGAHNISIKEPTQVIMNTTDFFIHEHWDNYLLRNDIAMIRLPQKLTFNDYIQPVCLPFPSENDLGVGEIVTSIGWGKLSDSQVNNQILMKVQTPTTSNAICQQTFTNLITPDIICTDSTGGMGICHGDSGGSLNYNTGKVTEVRGIASFVASAGCTIGKPDAFTRVTHYLDWIKKNTGVTRG